MRDFVITTDNTSDLPKEYYQEHGIEYLYLPYTIDGVVYNKNNELPYKEFYQTMRNGSMPTTSQYNPEDAKKVFTEILQSGKDVLHLAFSSGLSGSYNSARIAMEELMEEMPEGNVVVVDTLAASMGEGLLVYKAVQMKEAGESMETIAAWLEKNKLHACHVFTVDDLFHLFRGGRVSRTTAVIGTMINIKPILHVNDEGRLISLSKTRGRKKSMTALLSMMEERIGSFRDKNDVVMISHGDCEEDARYLEKLVEEQFGITNIMINPVGATIGAHTGPGVITLFFMGDFR